MQGAWRAAHCIVATCIPATCPRGSRRRCLRECRGCAGPCQRFNGWIANGYLMVDYELVLATVHLKTRPNQRASHESKASNDSGTSFMA